MNNEKRADKIVNEWNDPTVEWWDLRGAITAALDEAEERGRQDEDGGDADAFDMERTEKLARRIARKD